jgi:histidine ammonia-lyase
MRCLPQVNGLLLDALDTWTGGSAHLNVAAENPVIVSPTPAVARRGVARGRGPSRRFSHPGGGLACDSAAIAVAQSVPLLLGRLAMLVDPAATGLPAFLGDGTPGASGVMMLEYLAASALANLRAEAAPASLGSVTLSRGMEEHASFARAGRGPAPLGRRRLRDGAGLRAGSPPSGPCAWRKLPEPVEPAWGRGAPGPAPASRANGTAI